MSRILVTGSSGLLGLNLALQVCEQRRRHTVIGVVQQHALSNVPFQTVCLDLSSTDVLKKLLDTTMPDLVINCAALADLDSCENDPEKAYRLNSLILLIAAPYQ